MKYSYDTRGMIEPFPIGIQADIKSKDVALKVVKINTYYILLYAGVSFLLYFLKVQYSNNVPDNISLLYNSFLYLFLYFIIKQYMSRIASIIVTILTFIDLLLHILNFANGTSSIIFLLLTFFVTKASYRCIQATFFYHKKYNKNSETNI